MRASDVHLQAGTVFATDYRIVDRLDEGGMGLLYRAEQISTGEERALKVLRPSLLADGISRERFNQEATIGANIPSDHVVKVIGAGIDDDSGIPWIAMELLRGDNLQRVVRARGPLPRRDVLEIFAQLCHGLAAAHRSGIVHRDLKPENIFIARAQRRDAKSTVKLLDFGIAKVIQTYETSVTATAIVGSPLWMAPEQVRMGRIRPATDVWALGLLAFWMLTGKYYWRAAQNREVGQAEAILHEKLFEAIEPASKRATAFGVGDKLPEGFDEWFKRCVARDPDDRFADAERAFDALRILLTQKASPWAARMRGAAIGASVAAMMLATAWVATIRPTTRSTGARSLHPIGFTTHVIAPAVPTRGTGSATQDGQNAVTSETDFHSAEHQLPLPVAGPGSSVRSNTNQETGNGQQATAPSEPASAARSTRVPIAARVANREPANERTHATPQASGYLFRARTDTAGLRCDRAHPRAWNVTPDWAVALNERIRSAERTVQNERRMAQRSPTEEFASRVAADERLLAQEQSLAAAQIERSAGSERLRSASLARASNCTDEGLHVDGTSVYSVWCCP